MQTSSYSLTYREDGIHVAFFVNSERATIDLHFNTMTALFHSNPPNTPVYLIIDGSTVDKLPSINYLANRFRDFYKSTTVPDLYYIAFVYRRQDFVFSIYSNLLRTMRLNNRPRDFFLTEAEATAWLLSQQRKHSASMP